MKTRLTLIASILLTIACSPPKTNEQEQHKQESETIAPSLSAEEIVETDDRELVFGYDGMKTAIYITRTDTSVVLSAIKNGDEKPEEKVIDQAEYSYMHVEKQSARILEIDGVKYVYFAYHSAPMGKMILESHACFVLVCLSNLNFYKLVYEGRYTQKSDGIKGDFLDNFELDKAPKMKTKLLELSEKSTLIYHQSEEEKNPYSHLNYDEKWNEDNGADFAYAMGYSEGIDEILSTYYHTDLFKFYGTDPDTMVQNEQFVVQTSFRGYVLAYDKQKELYFPVFIESCTGFCDKELALSDHNILTITYEGEVHSFTIDMNEIIFDETIGD